MHQVQRFKVRLSATRFVLLVPAKQNKVISVHNFIFNVMKQHKQIKLTSKSHNPALRGGAGGTDTDNSREMRAARHLCPDVAALGSHLVGLRLGCVGSLLGLLQVVLSLPEPGHVHVGLFLLQHTVSRSDPIRSSDTRRTTLREIHSQPLLRDACTPSSCSGACRPNPAAGRCSSCPPQPGGDRDKQPSVEPQSGLTH